MFVEGANILTLSKGEDEAAESLDYSRFIYGQLPDFLRVPMGKDQFSLMTFPTMHSKIRALASTEDAGVGFGGATRVVMDEFEYHKYDRKNFSEILPPILEGGQLIIQSTADVLKPNTLFKELFIAARRGDNNFYPIFFPYDVLPGRTPVWYGALKDTGLREYEIKCRYPRNEQEALEVLKTRRFFAQDVLDEMRASVSNPIEHELSAKHRGLVRIFKPPVIGERYYIFTDPSDGKEDPHATTVHNKYGEQVASSHGKVPADHCALIHDDLVRLYFNALNSYELNARAGGIFSEKIKMLSTPNVCAFVKDDGKLDWTKKGWWTNEKKKRNIIWGLEEAIRLRKVKVNDIRFLDELQLFIQPEGEDPQSPGNGHDDCVIDLGAAEQIRKYLVFGDIKASTGTYRD